jgi:hypothetical protein
MSVVAKVSITNGESFILSYSIANNCTSINVFTSYGNSVFYVVLQETQGFSFDDSEIIIGPINRSINLRNLGPIDPAPIDLAPFR